MLKKKEIWLCIFAVVPFFLVAVIYELFPLLVTLISGFMDKNQTTFTLENFTNIFTKTIYQQAMLNSIKVSLVSSIAGIILAFIAANACYNATGRWKSFFTMLLNMSSNFAGVPLAFGFMLLLGNNGFLTMLGQDFHISFLGDFNLYSYSGLLLVYIYFQIPLATLLLLPSFTALRKEWAESVLLMGGYAVDYWGRVAIPNLLPSILGTISVLFSNALAAYATAYAIFQNNFALLPLQITKQYKGDVTIDKATGGALCLVLIVIMLIATGISNFLNKKVAKGGK